MIDARGRAWCDSSDVHDRTTGAAGIRRATERALVQMDAAGSTVMSAHLCGPCAVAAAGEHAQAIVDAVTAPAGTQVVMGGTLSFQPLPQVP